MIKKILKQREQKHYGCRVCRKEGCFDAFPAERAWLNPRSHEVFCGVHKNVNCVPMLIQEEA